MPPLIDIRPNGNLGNRIIQYMLADGALSRVPDATLTGVSLPELGLVCDQTTDFPATTKRLSGHRVPFWETVERLRRNEIEAIQISSPSARMEYFDTDLTRTRSLVHTDRVSSVDFASSLLIHVRLNKMNRYRPGAALSVHRDYPILPIAWYEQLTTETGLQPVFVGEFGQDPVTAELKARFPACPFIRSVDAIEDWRLIYSATNVVLSPSTFSWTAAWLSPHTQTIVLPLAGFLHPGQRPDVNLLPLQDDRYRFFELPVQSWSASETDIERVMFAPSQAEAVTPLQLMDRYAEALAPASFRRS